MNSRNHVFEFFAWMLFVGVILITSWSLAWFSSVEKNPPTKKTLMAQKVENSENVQETETTEINEESNENVIIGVFPERPEWLWHHTYSKLESPYFQFNRDGIVLDVTEQGRLETTLTVPWGVRELGAYSFSNCQNLERVFLPESLKAIRNFAFKNCPRLKEIEIPGSIKMIGKDIFSGCNQLNPALVINNSEVLFDWWVDNHKYRGKTMLQMTELNLADYKNGYRRSFKKIAPGAFSSCLNLRKIIIPDSIDEIGQGAFDQCKLLEHDTVINHSGVIFDWWTRNHNYGYGFETMLNYISENQTIDLTSFKNSSGGSFTAIGDKAFEHCTSLESIILPLNVQSIGDSAFECASSLKTIDLPESLVKIGTRAFSNCTSLTSVVVPSKVVELGYRAFAACQSLKKVLIKYGVALVVPGMFADCKSLTEVEIPKGIVKICDSAFLNCSSLKRMVVPEGVREIGSNVWQQCTELETIFLPSDLERVGDRLFANCFRLKSIAIPKSVTMIGNEIFMYNHGLRDIFINGRGLTYGKDLIRYINNSLVIYHVVDGKLYDDLINWGVSKERIKRVLPESQI